jgi:hypothetical protein
MEAAQATLPPFDWIIRTIVKNGVGKRKLSAAQAQQASKKEKKLMERIFRSRLVLVVVGDSGRSGGEEASWDRRQVLYNVRS